jgi:small nuclear ribonucleoprotein (snRNP)-like protein
MPWQTDLPYLMNQPVGISLVNGQGVSGVLCGVDQNNVYLLEYLYQTQFATKHYSFQEIQNISPFPRCQPGRI